MPKTHAHAYVIKAYDKDRDALDTICDLTPFHVSDHTAKQTMAFFGGLIRDEQIKTASGTPYDWAELYDGDKRIDFD